MNLVLVEFSLFKEIHKLAMFATSTIIVLRINGQWRTNIYAIKSLVKFVWLSL